MHKNRTQSTIKWTNQVQPSPNKPSPCVDPIHVPSLDRGCVIPCVHMARRRRIARRPPSHRRKRCCLAVAPAAAAAAAAESRMRQTVDRTRQRLPCPVTTPPPQSNNNLHISIVPVYMNCSVSDTSCGNHIHHAQCMISVAYAGFNVGGARRD